MNELKLTDFLQYSQMKNYGYFQFFSTCFNPSCNNIKLPVISYTFFSPPFSLLDSNYVICYIRNFQLKDKPKLISCTSCIFECHPYTVSSILHLEIRFKPHHHHWSPVAIQFLSWIKRNTLNNINIVTAWNGKHLQAKRQGIAHSSMVPGIISDLLITCTSRSY